LDLAEKYVSGALPRAPQAGPAGGRSVDDLPQIGRWSEVRMAAPELRLIGRADLVEREPGRVIVRDLKTGRVLTQAGELAPHFEREMRLYGLMARRCWPDAEIRLVIDDGIEHEVSFGAAEEQVTVTWLCGMLEALPPQSTQPAEALATPGEACQ